MGIKTDTKAKAVSSPLSGNRETWLALAEATGTATLFVAPFWLAAFEGIEQ